MRRLFLLPALVLITSCSSHVERIEVTELDFPPELGIVHRAAWGWQPLEEILPPHQIHYVTIHHGGEDFPADKDPIEYLRNLQSWSRTEKKWIDIPYHFMIDLNGTIYETRPINYPGDTNTGYDPTGHALICVMGNYENQILSEKQLGAVVALTAYLVEHFGVSLENIKGHKDYAETLCPGKDLYRYLVDGTIVRRVKDRLEKLSQ
ncbi:MAG TPA: peptidoglycan recognition family protein [Bacteroidota bacterium]|jgi:hypothetical protein